jgi:hypothetical protein
MLLAGNLHFILGLSHIIPYFPMIVLWYSWKKLILSHIIPYFPMFYDIPYWCDRKKKNWLLVIRQMSEASRRSSSPASPAPSGAPLGPWPWSRVPRAVAVGFSKYLYIYTGWWFQTFFIFHNIWDNPSYWLIFFRGVETTNQYIYINKGNI